MSCVAHALVHPKYYVVFFVCLLFTEKMNLFLLNQAKFSQLKLEVEKMKYSISTNSFHRNYFFFNLKIVGNSNSCRKFNFLPNKLNFYWGNYSREETIHGNTVNKHYVIFEIQNFNFGTFANQHIRYQGQ